MHFLAQSLPFNIAQMIKNSKIRIFDGIWSSPNESDFIIHRNCASLALQK